MLRRHEPRLVVAPYWVDMHPDHEEASALITRASFAAGLTYALSSGMEPAQALSLAARCGAVCATGRGPYERQLSAADL